MERDGRTEMQKLIVAFRNFVKAPKNHYQTAFSPVDFHNSKRHNILENLILQQNLCEVPKSRIQFLLPCHQSF